MRQKHKSHPFRKPFAEHTKIIFDRLYEFVSAGDRPIVLDSCCGVGESTAFLAGQFPNHLVIGVDKSLHRISKHALCQKKKPRNYLLVQAEIFDFWRLVHRAQWPVTHHFIFYPNPWPKKKDIGKRIHAHPVFRHLVQLSEHIELRSNWQIYVSEFSFAYSFYTGRDVITEQFSPLQPVTPFERKYCSSGHLLYRFVSA